MRVNLRLCSTVEMCAVAVKVVVGNFRQLLGLTVLEVLI